VNAYFRTFDQNQEPLTNLNAMNIGLMVKGKAYDPAKRQYGVQPLRQRPEAVRTVLVIDASKTMAGAPFEASLQAAARFIDHKRDQDQIAILAIRDTNEGYELVSTWERDRGALGRRLADVKCDGMKSRIYDTLGAAMQMAGMVAQESGATESQDYPVSTAIVIFSDGRDEGSALSREELNTRISTLQAPIPIYAVAYSKLSSEYFKNLESLSKNSFGKYYPVGQAFGEMQKVVENIQNVLLGDYVVTFRSYVPVDGEQHAFKLGVEYPSGSGKYTYEGAQFEAIEPPPVQAIRDQLAVLNQRIPALADGNPYLTGPTAVSAPAAQ
jgi:Mg-chelatase subunit ChlD